MDKLGQDSCGAGIAGPVRHEGRPPRARALSGLVLVGCVAGLAACSRTEPAPEPVRSVRTLVVGGEAQPVTLSFAGEVRARTESRMGFRVGGLLVERPAQLGQAVRAGQLLARLDPGDLRLGQDAARAAVVAARAQSELASADLSRFRELREQGFISGAELERREAAARAAQASQEQAQAQLGVQGNQAAYTRLVAPVAGVITAVEAEPGAVLGAGAPVLRLAHDGPRDIVFSVPEQQVAAIRALTGRADALTVAVPGAGVPPQPARVREVAAAADPMTRTFLVKADAGTAAAAAWQLGQSATVGWTPPQAVAGVRLPRAALREAQGRTEVWVVDAGSMKVQPTAVRLRGVDAEGAWVAEGLQPGQRVVTAGVHTLTPGQVVRLYDGQGGETGATRRNVAAPPEPAAAASAGR